MKAKYAQNKKCILQVLGMSEDAYNTLLYNTAISWVRKAVWKDEIIVQLLTKEEMFWEWFINHWNMREDAFIHKFLDWLISDGNHREFLRVNWEYIHELERINVIMPDALIRKVLKEAKG